MAGISTDFTRINIRQRKYIEALAKCGSKQEALRAAGYAESTRAVRVENASVKAAFSKLVRQYVPAHKIAQTIADGLDAKETKFFQHEGKVVETHDVINYAERRQYAKLAGEFGQYVEAEKGAEVNVGLSFTLINGVTRPK